jgi:hypothetical protein
MPMGGSEKRQTIRRGGYSGHYGGRSSHYALDPVPPIRRPLVKASGSKRRYPLNAKMSASRGRQFL